MHQIKRKLILLQPWSKKLEILLFFRHAQCSPLAACSFVTEHSLGKLEKGEAGEIDWVSLLFYTSVLTLSESNVWDFHLVMTGNSENQNVLVTSKRFLTIFWRVLNIAENVWRCSSELWELPKLFKSDNFSLFCLWHFKVVIHFHHSLQVYYFSGVVD